MRVKRSIVEKIVKEELKKLVEAKPKVDDANDDKKSKEKLGDKNQKISPQVAASGASVQSGEGGKPAPKQKTDPEKDDAKKPPVQPTPEEPADDEIEKDVESGEEDEDESPVGKVGEKLVGKTIQSITQEPKSKIMPGAQEIVVQFNQTPEPLRILINKSGVVKFYLRQLHNML